MKRPTPSPYMQIASSIRVTEIATPLKVFSPQTELIAIHEELSTTLEEEGCCLVRDEDHLYGYLSLEDEAFNSPCSGVAGDKSTQITADLLLEASTPLLNLPALFKKNFFFFVLTGNEVTHVVSFLDVDKLPMKLCLFSLFAELEEKLLALFMMVPYQIEQYLNLLSTERLEKARNLCRMKYGDDDVPRRIMQCTTFIDKKEMLKKSSELVSRLPFSSKNQLDRAFKRYEDVRNQIAHGDTLTYILRNPQAFHEFVTGLQGLIKAIEELCENKRAQFYYSVSLKFFPNGACILVLEFSIGDPVQGIAHPINEIVSGLRQEARKPLCLH